MTVTNLSSYNKSGLITVLSCILSVILWFIIRNMKLIIDPISSTELLKSLEFPKWDRDKGIFCYVNEVAFGPHLRMEAGHGEPTLWLKGWNFLFCIFLIFFIQQVLISHQFYTHQCIHVNPKCPIHHTTIPTLNAAFPPWYPYVCSLHLCLNFCPANRFTCTIFLGSTYMR